MAKLNISENQAKDLLDKAVKEVNLEKLRKDANRKVNLLYLIAGAYEQALELVDKALEVSKLDLVHRDKQLVKEINRCSKKLRYLINTLQDGSVLKLNNDDQLVHEDTLHIFFALFMAIVDRAGTDEYSTYRLYHLYNQISKYPSRIKFDFLSQKENTAFEYLKNTIKDNPNLGINSSGEIFYSKGTTFKSLMEL